MTSGFASIVLSGIEIQTSTIVWMKNTFPHHSSDPFTNYLLSVSPDSWPVSEWRWFIFSSSVPIVILYISVPRLNVLCSKENNPSPSSLVLYATISIICKTYRSLCNNHDILFPQVLALPKEYSLKYVKL